MIKKEAKIPVEEDVTVKKVWFIQTKHSKIEDYYTFKIDKQVQKFILCNLRVPDQRTLSLLSFLVEMKEKRYVYSSKKNLITSYAYYICIVLL